MLRFPLILTVKSLKPKKDKRTPTLNEQWLESLVHFKHQDL